MTREEAKALFESADGSELNDTLLDTIYDSLDNRKCATCIHLELSNFSEDKCKNGVGTYWKPYIDDKYDFYCKGWRLRNE